MGLGTDIANKLTAQHTVERDEAIMAAVKAGHFVPIEWVEVPLEHRNRQTGNVLRGKVWVAKHALQVGEPCDFFRPNVSHPTAQRIADLLWDQPKADAPDGVVLPTAKIMDAAAKVADVIVDPCLQSPAADMGSTKRMLEHSECVDKSIGNKTGLTNQEGKGWANTVKLKGRPQLSANYGLYAAGARYRGVLGLQLWQPGPGTAHISGIGSTAAPQGYTDYSQVLERLVRVDMWVEGRGMMDIHEVAAHRDLAWLISTEGPLSLRHPGVPGPGDEVPVDDPGAPVVRPPTPILTRTLRLGASGTDVAFVQRVVGTKADGIFGPKTRDAVKMWQLKHKDAAGRPLDVDGIVGPKTRAAMLSSVTSGVTPKPEPDVPEDIIIAAGFDPFKAVYRAARYFRMTVRSVVHWIVLHSAETGEFPTAAEALQSYATHMSDGRQVSWNWAMDSDSATLSVLEKYVAFHAGKANQYSVGYEHAGYARQTREEWLDDYSMAMLEISAKVAALYTGPAWDIPLDNVVDADGLKQAYALILQGKPVPNHLRGFTTHAAVSKALGGTHGDPGKNFPMDVYLDLVHAAA